MAFADTWIQIAVAIVAMASLLTTIIIYRNTLRRKDFDSFQAREDKQDSQIMELQDKVNRMGSELRHAPTHEDMGKLHEKLNAVSRELSEINATTKSNTRTTEMIQQYLMEKKHG